MAWWWGLLIGVAVALAALWVALMLALLIVRPRADVLREAARLLPDVLRLVSRLATDPAVPRGERVRLVLLLAYLASPMDLVPDVIPILGHADDAIVAVVVLRGVLGRLGPDALRSRWPGSDDGFATLAALLGRSRPAPR